MKVTVIGAGTMGRGIAQVFAQAGNEVVVTDVYDKALSTAMTEIRKSLEKLYSKNLISEDPETVISRISPTNNMVDGKDTKIFIEAVLEKKELKESLYKELNEFISAETIVATNTSSISINALSASIKYPENFIGLHFFNPVPVMKLVEIIKGEKTSEKVVSKTLEIVKSLGKEPVTSNDFPGFISNRILMPLIREAILTLEQGVSTKEDIDKTLRLGMNHPMGPLELADFIGLDVVHDIMHVLYTEFGDPRFMPPVTLRNLVNAKKLGKKSGEGFYSYQVKK